MNIRNIPSRLRSELLRAFRGNKYDITDTGIYIPSAKLGLSGRYGVSVTRNGERGPREVGDNLIVNQGLTYALKAAVAGFTQISVWYIAPFSGNVTPVAGLTAATFTATQTEFTNYDESTRVLWDQQAESGQEINNTGFESAFTLSAGGGSMWGFALLSASAKSATTGTMLSCYKMAAERTGLLEGDIVNVDFALTCADA